MDKVFNIPANINHPASGIINTPEVTEVTSVTDLFKNKFIIKYNTIQNDRIIFIKPPILEYL